MNTNQEWYSEDKIYCNNPEPINGGYCPNSTEMFELRQTLCPPGLTYNNNPS
jgi:hypothetical protein